MYQKLIIVGRLTRDPEMRYTPNGKAVTNFSLAVDDGFGENKQTIFYRVTAWDKQAETCNQFLKKGNKALVEGKLVADANGGPRTWTDQSGNTRASFEMTASTVRFLSSKQEGEQAEADPAPDNEIPF